MEFEHFTNIPTNLFPLCYVLLNSLYAQIFQKEMSADCFSFNVGLTLSVFLILNHKLLNICCFLLHSIGGALFLLRPARSFCLASAAVGLRRRPLSRKGSEIRLSSSSGTWMLMSELLSSDCVVELLEDCDAELPLARDFGDRFEIGEFVRVTFMMGGSVVGSSAVGEGLGWEISAAVSST